MITKLRKWLWNWLGLGQLKRDQQTTQNELYSLSRAFHEQMKMVGIDVGLKNNQTTIIFISRLGREGEGTVRIVPAHFKNFSELREFIRYVDRSFDPDKVTVDAPYYIQRELRGKERW